jgi:hypothetical protein
MTLTEFLKKKIKKTVGLSKYDGRPNEDDLTFINDAERLIRTRIREYNIWYEGDGDELLNFYTNQNTFEYNYEPFYMRNKKNYFWAISSTEADIKRTHSGLARSIVDTLVCIMPFPLIRVGKDDLVHKNEANEVLKKILHKNKIKSKYKQKQMPLTLVEGWGCWKINWNENRSKYPTVLYYRADSVDFVYRNDEITGIIFKDWYTDGDKRYMLTETRKIVGCNLVIESELFEVNKTDSEYIVKADLENCGIAALKHVVPRIEIANCPILFAEPSIIYEDSSKNGGPGRSIFAGKIDLLDDLDQCISQDSNSVRRSTVIEYFNTDFLERDAKTGLPKQPKAYDRKYTMYAGQRTADGASTSNDPVQVTQPNVNFEQYSNEAISIISRIIHGIMSPATLGIDIAKRDNAEAQREKEKVTIFTRNGMIDSESDILYGLCNQLLCAYELINTGKITNTEYDISIRYSEFADDSFENRLKTLSEAYNAETLSDKMYMKKLYGDTLNEEEFQEELEWLKEYHTEPRADGMKGASGGGRNLPGMFGNEEL